MGVLLLQRVCDKLQQRDAVLVSHIPDPIRNLELVLWPAAVQASKKPQLQASAICATEC